MAEVVAVLALLPSSPPHVAEPPAAAVTEPVVAAPVAAKPTKSRRMREKEAKREAARDRAAAPPGTMPATARSAVPSPAPPARTGKAVPAVPEDVRPARPIAETAAAAPAAVEGTELVEGIWVGVRLCPDAPDMHIAVKIAADKAWVYFHSGPATAPLSPGCLSATWSYNAERTYLQILPQAWRWRMAQATAIRLGGFVSGKHIDGEIADVPGCRAVRLHKAAASDFPAECH